MSTFAELCRHCDHYREKAGMCCFCGVSTLDIKVKTREEHLAELGDLDDEDS